MDFAGKPKLCRTLCPNFRNSVSGAEAPLSLLPGGKCVCPFLNAETSIHLVQLSGLVPLYLRAGEAPPNTPPLSPETVMRVSERVRGTHPLLSRRWKHLWGKTLPRQECRESGPSFICLHENTSQKCCWKNLHTNLFLSAAITPNAAAARFKFIYILIVLN